MSITLVIADDHPLILDAMENLFRLEKDLKVVARCLDGDKALAGGTAAPTGHFGARYSDAGKRRLYGAPRDEKGETAYARRGSHGYSRRRRIERGGPSRRARPRAQGVGAETSRAMHPESARRRTVAGAARW